MKKFIGMALAIVLLAFVSSCKKDDNNNNTTPTPTGQKGTVELTFENVFGTEDLKLNTEYTTAANEKLKFTTIKYYISNIMLEKADGTFWAEAESYHLLDATIAASQSKTLINVPTGDYKSIRFTVGVDSARNTSGAQTGALDPANTMFWSWNSGYIFIKLEGTSAQSPSGNFKYHVGGFKGANNALQIGDVSFGTDKLTVKNAATAELHLKTDIKLVFDGQHETINVATLNDVHMPGANAIKVAENFHHAITFDHIHN